MDERELFLKTLLPGDKVKVTRLTGPSYLTTVLSIRTYGIETQHRTFDSFGTWQSFGRFSDGTEERIVPIEE